METMLQKAAQAVCAKVEADDGVWYDLSEADQASYVDLVKAALTAIMEPSEEFMRLMYPDPDCEGGDQHGMRSRYAGRQQIRHFVQSILSEEG